MSTNLIVGPLLRYTGETEATVWVETDAACEVEVLGGRSRTFCVEGHHYALVRVTNLEPGETYEYAVTLDERRAWPEADDPYPPPVIRTIARDQKLNLAFGSCRVSAPHEKPYTLTKDQDSRGYEWDALYALASRMLEEPEDAWPDALLMLGDQVYADEVSPGTSEFIRSRRDPDDPPGGNEVADFEEYTRLYWDSWREPVIRWLLSTVPSAMIFDDHDVHDDWNTSETWERQMRRKWWWEERINGAFVSYWIYQHLGNLSPRELEEDEVYSLVNESEDPGRVLREFAYRADRESAGSRWSFYRDFGKVRLIVMDSRAGRVLREGSRSMLDADEWAWIENRATGDFDHLLFGTSLPFLLSPALHYLEVWNEAVCRGVWGKFAARLGEIIRQGIDLEHWPAFPASFDGFASLLGSVARGERSQDAPPACVAVLSGDVHHGYLARANLGDESASPVYQAVCSPLRNPLSFPERLVMRLGWSKAGESIGKTLCWLAGASRARIGWRLSHGKPWFDNQIATLEISGREASIHFEKTSPKDSGKPRLHPVLSRRLT